MSDKVNEYSDERKADLESCIGKVIASAAMEDDANRMALHFTNGDTLYLFDDGQTCCEKRYMVCDDDLRHLEGSTFLGVDLADGPDLETGDDSHEQQFMNVLTSSGVVTVSNHNEHNGFYGGFSVQSTLVRK